MPAGKWGQPGPRGQALRQGFLVHLPDSRHGFHRLGVVFRTERLDLNGAVGFLHQAVVPPFPFQPRDDFGNAGLPAIPSVLMDVCSSSYARQRCSASSRASPSSRVPRAFLISVFFEAVGKECAACAGGSAIRQNGHGASSAECAPEDLVCPEMCTGDRFPTTVQLIDY